MTAHAWDLCPVCDGAAHAPHVTFDSVAFVRCTGCGTVYKSFEAAGLLAADFYEAGYFQGRRSGREHRFERRVRKAMGEIADALEHVRAASVLDVGCSLGYVMEAGQRLGLEAAGVDVSRHAVEACAARGLVAKVGTTDALPFDAAAFDVVVMKHVLEHTPTPARALEEVRRVLRPGGAVVIAVPDVGYWKGDRQRRTYRYYRPDDLGAQHYVYYSESSLAQRLARSGFEVLARGKTRVRSALARRSLGHALSEPFRAVGTRLGRAVGGALGLRREVYLVARRG